MKLNTLSIVIAYSGENQYLDELMASILANSNLHEIIIGVDETKVSKAHAIEVWSHWTIAAHEKGIPFAITFSQKPGPSAVRNAAIAHSGSDLILPVDSDDKISNSYVQRIIEAFNSDPSMIR